MSANEKIKILNITYYMDTPPSSGGTLRILYPFMMMEEGTDISVDFLFSTYDNQHAEKCRKYLEDIPVIEHAEGVVTKQYMSFREAIPDGFSEDVWVTLSRELRDRAVELVGEKKYDIIQIEHSQLSWIVPYLRVASPESVFVLDCHNVEHGIYKTWLPYATPDEHEHVLNKFTTLKAWEEKVWGWYDAALAVSSEEEDILQENGISRTYVVPSGGGISPEKYCPANDDRDRPYDILYLGSQNWFPNAQGLLWFIREVFPSILETHPDVKLNIVGAGNPFKEIVEASKKHDNIVFWGQQEDDVKFFQGAKVFICPLWIGAGVRVKILTAWASKAPVVSTVFGAEGNGGVDGEHLLLADDPERFADCVCSLLDNPKLAEEISNNGFDLLCREYTARRAAEILNDTYHKLTKERFWQTSFSYGAS